MQIMHLLNMNGYGIYVWPAYGITLVIFAINIIHSLREKNRIKKMIADYLSHTPSSFVHHYES